MVDISLLLVCIIYILKLRRVALLLKTHWLLIAIKVLLVLLLSNLSLVEVLSVT